MIVLLQKSAEDSNTTRFGKKKRRKSIALHHLLSRGIVMVNVKIFGDMNELIKQKAQELYPIESHANEHTAFLQGAKEMREVVRLGLAEIMEQCTIDELTEICSAPDKMQEVLRKYKNIVE